ncbi:ribosomal protein S16 domain-containing protein [Fomes fomentarius]|nr:ribosomal protein S16 domain-containing protein [Fomes fomentarius]
MAVRIRMAVHGVTNNRIFHIVAVNQRQRRNVKPIELLGVYNPRLKPGENTKIIEWSVQRIQYWLNVGATPSRSVTKLLQMGGILPAASPSAS